MVPPVFFFFALEVFGLLSPEGGHPLIVLYDKLRLKVLCTNTTLLTESEHFIYYSE